jgi:cytochrome oxidase Cu insertion factor (SCO1/SenC/PrrC family)
MTERDNRLLFLLIAAIFAVPIAAAVLWYYALPALHPQQRTNYGLLIDPARPLPALHLVAGKGDADADALRGKWSFVYLGGAECGDACRARLLLFRQIRLALGKDLNRVQRVYIAPDAAARDAAQTLLAPLHPDLRSYADAGAPGARAADFFAPTDPDAIYVVDPLGNWLLVYAGKVDPKGVYADLHKLLNLSSIG